MAMPAVNDKHLLQMSRSEIAAEFKAVTGFDDCGFSVCAWVLAQVVTSKLIMRLAAFGFLGGVVAVHLAWGMLGGQAFMSAVLMAVSFFMAGGAIMSVLSNHRKYADRINQLEHDLAIKSRENPSLQEWAAEKQQLKSEIAQLQALVDKCRCKEYEEQAAPSWLEHE